MLRAGRDSPLATALIDAVAGSICDMREAFAAQLAELERRIEDGLERASVILADIAEAILDPALRRTRRRSRVKPRGYVTPAG